jgi:beta-glucosidase-like glycosyl hydrolase
MAVAYVKGVQSRHVIVSPKHFVCNNQEWERLNISAEVGPAPSVRFTFRLLKQLFNRAVHGRSWHPTTGSTGFLAVRTGD